MLVKFDRTAGIVVKMCTTSCISTKKALNITFALFINQVPELFNQRTHEHRVLFTDIFINLDS